MSICIQRTFSKVRKHVNDFYYIARFLDTYISCFCHIKTIYILKTFISTLAPQKVTFNHFKRNKMFKGGSNVHQSIIKLHFKTITGFHLPALYFHSAYVMAL